jgi:hypothetical protein
MHSRPRPLRWMPLLLSLFLAAFLAGCEGGTGPVGPSGPNGPAGPQGPDGGPGPVSLLVLGSDDARLTEVTFAIYGAAGLPDGSTVDSWQWSGAGTVPVLADLTPYEVILCYSNSGTPNGAAVGDVLADYVDAGGHVLLAQGLFVTGFELLGRTMTDGYSPWNAAGASGDGSDRMINLASVSLPPHPVFTGINLTTWAATQAVGFALSSPPNLGTPTTIATFTNGENAVAINANGRVMAINLIPKDFEDDDVTNLLANGVLFLAGEL